MIQRLNQNKFPEQKQREKRDFENSNSVYSFQNLAVQHQLKVEYKMSSDLIPTGSVGWYMKNNSSCDDL